MMPPSTNAVTPKPEQAKLTPRSRMFTSTTEAMMAATKDIRISKSGMSGKGTRQDARVGALAGVLAGCDQPFSCSSASSARMTR